MSIFQAIMISLWGALIESRILGFGCNHFRSSPLMSGFVVGLIMGNLKQGIIVAAAIQLIYMGLSGPGGDLPSEPGIAASIAIPAAIIGNLSPKAAIAIAFPVGLLGSYLYQFRFFLNTFLTKLMDKYAREANDKGLTMTIVVLPTLISFILFTPVMFIASYYGAPVIGHFMNQLSGGPLFHILEVIGGGLAAVGIAVTLQVIGKKSLLPFFILGFFMTVALAPLKINTVTFAIFGIVFALLYVMFTSDNHQTE